MGAPRFRRALFPSMASIDGIHEGNKGGGSGRSAPFGAGELRRMFLLTLPFALLFMLAAPGALPAQEPAPPLVGDRPDFTESASVVPRLQVETGYSYVAAEGPDGTGLHTLGELLVRVPAASRLELRIGAPSVAWTDAADGPAGGSRRLHGLTDASVGMKLGILDPGPGGGPRVALLGGTAVPTGGDLGSDGLHPEGRLAAALDLGDRLSVAANLGAASAGEGTSRHAELAASLAVGVGLTEGLGTYLEGYGFAPAGGGPAASSVVNGGLTWRAGPDLQLDARLGTGLSGPSPDLIVGTGVVWRP